MTLRPAEVYEAQLIAQMHSNSWRATYKGMLPDQFIDVELDGNRRDHWLMQLPEIRSGLGEVVIAEVDGQAAGFLCVIRPDQDNSVLVDNLHAMPGYKGLGIGTLLLEYAHDWAKARSASSLHLFVLEPNTVAAGFYASRGWTKVGAIDDHMGHVDIIALRYERAVSSP